MLNNGYLYIALTILFTVYGQLILKWRISSFGALPINTVERIKFLGLLLTDPAIISGFLGAFLASLAWMIAMTKFELSHAYPFMSLNFIVVFFASVWLLNEPFTWAKCLGVTFIVLGTIIIARG